MGAQEPLPALDAWLFDLDGVLTATSRIHAACWKEMFDKFLEQRAKERGEPFVPFDAGDDYLRYVDGKPRAAGVRDFLASRGIEMPEGTPADPASAETVNGLGNRKDRLVTAAIARGEVEVFPASVEFVRLLRRDGMRTAVVSSSRNTVAVLNAVGIADLFDVRVDGVVAAERSLPGKPQPDTFLAAASDLGVAADRAAVVEDATAGVAAGRAGAFGLVVGVDRGAGHDALLAAGADMVVGDLGELIPRLDPPA